MSIEFSTLNDFKKTTDTLLLETKKLIKENYFNK